MRKVLVHAKACNKCLSFPEGVEGAQYAITRVVAGSINGPNPYTALSINHYLIVTKDNSSFLGKVTSIKIYFYKMNDGAPRKVRAIVSPPYVPLCRSLCALQNRIRDSLPRARP